MRYVCSAAVAALSILSCSTMFAQGGNLSVGNFQFVSATPSNPPTNWLVTYSATVTNTGAALGSVSAQVGTTQAGTVRVYPGLDTLNFGPVPANGSAHSNNNITLIVNRVANPPFNFNLLTWTFTTTPAGPIANAGPNQTVPIHSSVILNGSGSTNPSGVGTLTYNWIFTVRPPGSQAILLHSGSVNPGFVADVQGSWTISLTVSNDGGLTNSAPSFVTVSTVNSPPVANPGPSQTVPVGSTVTLNGSGSTDVDGDTLSYSWIFTNMPAGSGASLNGATTVSPTFIADKPGEYDVQLTVSDGHGNSNSAKVIITTQNSPPVANAGNGQTVNVGSPVQLDGSGSTDVDGDTLSYSWSFTTKPASSQASLSNPNIVNPTFTADQPGTYTLQLIVNDNHGNSSTATVSISTNVLPPTANAGQGQTVQVGTVAQLNGSGTDPQKLPLTYQWSLPTKPSGSTASLSSTISNPTFVPDMPGTYGAQLIVNNGVLNSPPSTVSITSNDTPPVANPGQPQTVTVNNPVTLNGSGSTDSDGHTLTYSWSIIGRPTQTDNVSLTGATTASPSFTPDLVGTYVVQLIVNDGFFNSTPQTVSITVIGQPTLALAPSPLNIDTSGTGTLVLTLPAPAGTNGQIVHLSNGDPTVISIPFSVTVPQGSTTANVTVTPVGPGSTQITAFQAGFLQTSATVNVVAAAITLTTDSGNLGVTHTMNGQITLSGPAQPAGVTIALSASPLGVLDVEPPSVTISGGNTTGAFTVKGLAVGSATISGTSGGYASGSANAKVSSLGQINLQSGITVGPNQSAAIAVTLSAGAPAGGVTINLSSSNPSIATIPSSVFIAQGLTTPATQPQVTGVNFGSSTISASATGFGGASQGVQVSATLSFQPTSTIILNGATQNLTLNLSAPAPAGLTINLSSSNTAAATVPTSLPFPANATSISVPVTTVAQGSAVIHASSLPNLTDVTSNVTVSLLGQVNLPSALTVQSGQQTPLNISLSAAAPAGGITITLASSNTNQVSLSTTTVVIPQNATAPTQQPTISGVQVTGNGPLPTITATANGYTGANSSVTVTPGTGATVIVTGSGQSAQVTKAFASQLVVTVKDGNNNLVPNAAVTFGVPNSGASATLSPAGPYTTNAQGQVTVTATANTIAGGPYTITVTSAQGSFNVSLTNTPGPANSITATSGTPQSTPAGSAFNAQLVVTVTDANNNPIPSVSVTFAGPGSGPSATFSPSAILTTDANGQAKVTATANSSAGTQYTVTATATGVSTPANFLLTNTAGQAKNVTATGGITQNTPINAAFGTALQATVTDASNNPVQGVTVTFTVNAVGGAGASFTGPNTAVTNASGVATANTLTANGTAGTYTVTASVAVAGSSTATFNLTNNPPATVTAGAGANQQTLVNTNFPTALQATVTDSHGNPVPGVTVTFTGPTGSVPSIVTATATTNPSGVASTLVMANTVAGGTYTVNATVSGVATPAAFANMTNKPGAVATLTISGGNNQSATVGANFTQLQVTATDASSNPVQGATVTFTPNAGGTGASGSFTGGTTAVTNASGIATANLFTANTKAGGFTVTASSGTPSVTFNLTNLAGPAAAISATGGATQSVKTGSPYAAFFATVTDANNNPVQNATVTFTVNPVNGAGGAFGGGNTAATNAAGVAQSSILTANSTIGAFTVTASVSGLGATATYNLTNLGGDPKNITPSAGNNKSAPVTTAYVTNLAVTVTDVNNNLLPGVSVTYTVNNAGNGAGATFANGTATTTASTVAGVAQATVLTANGVAGAFTVTASANGGANGTITTTFNLTNVGGAASKVSMVSGSPQQTTVGAAFGAQLVALVTDANNNPVGAGIQVSFAGSGIQSSPVTGTTDATGTAKSGTITASGTASAYTVTASVSGGTTSATFNLTNLPGPPAAVAIVSGNNQSASLNGGFASPLVVTVTDALNNPVPGVVVSFAGPGSGAGIQSSPVSSQPTNSAGTAQVSVTANGTAGSYSVVATPASGSGSATFTLTNNPPAAGGISMKSGSGQDTPVYNAFANPLQALVVDTSNNPLPGVSVTFTAGTNSTTGSSATFGGVASNTATVITDANGVATSPIVIANGNGPVTIKGFTTPGLYSVTAAVTSNQNLNTHFLLTNDAPAGIVVSSASIGQNLESIITVTLPSPCALPAPNGCSVALSSNNQSGLLFASHQGDTGSATLNTSVQSGASSVGIYVQGLASTGTATVTAASSGYTSGTGTVVLTPSAFVLANPNQVVGAPSYVTNQGTQSTFTVYAGQLDASNNYLLPQPVRGGLSPSVVVNTSNAGVISGTSVTFTGGVSSQTFTITPQAAGNATISLTEPTGFVQTPSQGVNSIAVTVQSQSLSAPNLTLGKNLQTDLQVQFNGALAAVGTNVTITSADPTKLLFSTDPTQPGQASIVVTVGGLNPTSHTQSFYAQALASSGTVNYTFSADTYGSNTSQVTLGPSGMIVAPPNIPFLNGQYLTQVSNGPATFSVFPALLDGSGNQVGTSEQITIAGGITVNVTVGDDNAGVGTISTSPVTLTGGMSSADTQFVPVAPGVTTVSISLAPGSGFATPSQASSSFVIQVVGPKLTITGDGRGGGPAPVIGQHLQTFGTVSLGSGNVAPTGGLSVTLTSQSANLLISGSESAAGSSTAIITIPAGSSSATFFLQAVGNTGSANYTATATGYQTGTGSVTFAPSAAILLGPSIESSGVGSFTEKLTAGAATFTVQTVVNDGTCNTSSSPNNCNTQEVAGGMSATVNLTSSNTAKGTISSPVTFPGGQGFSQSATFTPVATTGSTPVNVTIQSVTGLSGSGIINSATWVKVAVTIQ